MTGVAFRTRQVMSTKGQAKREQAGGTLLSLLCTVVIRLYTTLVLHSAVHNKEAAGLPAFVQGGRIVPRVVAACSHMDECMHVLITSGMWRGCIFQAVGGRQLRH